MYRVRAVNAGGQGENSGEVSGTTHDTPDMPTGLTAKVSADATTNTSSDIALEWIAPTNNGGLDITNYQVETSTDNGLTWSSLQAAGGDRNGFGLYSRGSDCSRPCSHAHLPGQGRKCCWRGRSL